MRALRTALSIPLAGLLTAGILSAPAHADPTGQAHAEPTAPAPQRPVVGAYYEAGSSDRYPIAQVPASVTHLNYAFATIQDGRCSVPDSAAHDFAELARLKRQRPNLHTEISLGGWNAGGFSDAALTDTARRKLVRSCVNMFFQRFRGSFDGIDLDWEFPVYGGPDTVKRRPQDRHNATLLAEEFRRQLDGLAAQRHTQYLLTAAIPGARMESDGPYEAGRSYELADISRSLNFINLMTYDMGTTYVPHTDFNAPLRASPDDPMPEPQRQGNNVMGAVDYFRRHGVPASKLVLGEPFYGRGYTVQQDGPRAGLYQPHTGTVQVGDYRDIKAKLLPDPAFTQHRDRVTAEPWLYNPDTKTFVSYEDRRSIAAKSQFAKRAGLAGDFTWHLAGDDDAGTLLKAMSEPFQSG